MPRKLQVDKAAHEALPEADRGQYEPLAEQEGVYRLKDIDLEGWEPTEAAGGLKEAIRRERETARAAKKALNELEARLPKMPTKEEALQKALDDERAAHKLETQQSQLAANISASKGNSAALMIFLKGSGLTFTKDGSPKLGDKIFVDAAELVLELKQNPALAGMWAGSGNSGGRDGGFGGSSGNGGSKTDAAAFPKTRSKFSISQKVAFIKAHGSAAYQNLPA